MDWGQFVFRLLEYKLFLKVIVFNLLNSPCRNVFFFFLKILRRRGILHVVVEIPQPLLRAAATMCTDGNMYIDVQKCLTYGRFRYVPDPFLCLWENWRLAQDVGSSEFVDSPLEFGLICVLSLQSLDN